MNGFADRFADRSVVAAVVGFRHEGEQQHGDGVCNGGRKENQRQRHSGQHAVDAQCFCIVIAVTLQALGNVDGLQALQEIDGSPVQGKRHGKGQQPLGIAYVGGYRLFCFLYRIVGGSQGAEAEIDGGQAEQHGSGFADDKPCNGKADGRFVTSGSIIYVNEINASHPYNLFRQLGQGRNGSLSDSVEIAVDAGVYGSHRYGKGNNAEQGGSPWLKQELFRNGIRKQVDVCSAGSGQQHGYAETGKKGTEGISVIVGSGFACHEFGDSSLDSGYGKGKGQCQYRSGKLVQPHAFGTKYAGKEDAVKKADETADKTGDGQNDGACDKRI